VGVNTDVRHRPQRNPERHPEPLLLTLAEAAKLLAIGERTLWRLTDDGEIPVVRVGRRGVRYDRRDLVAWIDRAKRKACLCQEQDLNLAGAGGPAG
jgi:excisionase family DNA binding protein